MMIRTWKVLMLLFLKSSVESASKGVKGLLDEFEKIVAKAIGFIEGETHLPLVTEIGVTILCR
jgi:hypothetical protein